MPIDDRSSVFRLRGILLLVGVLLLSCLCATPASAGRLDVRSAILLDARSGKVLYAQNPDVQIPPASLTKVLSMMVALDHIRAGRAGLTDWVRVSRNAANQSGSKMFIRKGERLTLDRLLMGMAVSSGNDASMAVAEFVGGSSKKFVQHMNAKAAQLGMTNSTFKNPNGLPAKGQFTTARDMGRLSYQYLKTHPRALRYHRMQSLKHNGQVTTNKNPLLGSCPGADGLKTGWIVASGYNIISTVRRGNTRLIAVVLGAQNSSVRSSEIHKLVEAGFESRARGVTVASVLRSNRHYASAHTQQTSVASKEKSRVSRKHTSRRLQASSNLKSRDKQVRTSKKQYRKKITAANRKSKTSV
ncbi:MAG: D-alanyl-D-alanine carboxypeptidase family protein, partial [Bilophila sp.]